MKAYLKNYRQSPRKVRLVADVVRGKSVAVAETELAFLPKRASEMFSKLIKSAVANAVNNDGKNPDNLFIKEVRVDEGPTQKRYIAKWRGIANRIRKRTSNITLVLGEK